MKIPHIIVRPDATHHRDEQKIRHHRLKGRPTSEVTNVANSVSYQTNKYSTYLHRALKKWSNDNQVLSDLIQHGIKSFGKGAKPASKVLQKIASTQTSPSFPQVPLDTADSQIIYNWATTRTPAQQKSIHAYNWSVTTIDKNGQQHTYNAGAGNDHNMYEMISAAKEAESKGETLDPEYPMFLSLTPKQAAEDQKSMFSFAGGMPALRQLEMKISSAQRNLKDDYLTVMFFSNAIRMSQKTASSAIKALVMAANAALRNISS